MGFAKDSGILLFGLTIQRVLSVTLIPLVAWLLGPLDYGIFNIAASICTLCSVIGSLSLEASIAITDTRKQALFRAICTSLIGILSGVFFFALVYFSQPYLLKYFSPDVIYALLWMIPFFVPLTIVNISLQNYVTYLGEFRWVAFADIASSVTNYVALITVYFLISGDYFALILASLVSSATRIIVFLRSPLKGDLGVRSLSLSSIRKEVWEARHFIKFNFPCNILNSANVQLPPALLSLRYPESVVGLFVMARNIMMIPATLSGQALGQVFYPKAAKEYREGRGLQGITWRTFLSSCQLTLFPTIFIVSAAGFVLPILLGSKWSGIAIYTVLLLPMVLLNGIQTQIGIGFIFNILNQESKVLLGNGLLFLFRIGPLIVSLFIAEFHVYATVLIYSIGSAAGYAFLLVWIFLTTSISLRKAGSSLLKYLTLAVLCIWPLLLSVLSDKPLFLLFCLFLSGLMYGLVVWFEFLNDDRRSSIIEKTHGSLSFVKSKMFSLRKLN